MNPSDLSFDSKVVKRRYPTSNLEDQLVFIFDSDPNLCMVKNKIAIHFTIELDENYVPDNGFAAKQFESLSVEVNSQRVSNTKTKGEYYLSDWLSKVGNFNNNYIESAFVLEGYFDMYNLEQGSEDQKMQIAKYRRQGRKRGNKYVYEMIFTPNDAFLNQNLLLPPNSELKLSFERLPAEFSSYFLGKQPQKGKVFELKDCYAEAEYVSSRALRNFGDSINSEPIGFKYDETSVYCKVLPINEKYIRLDNIVGGNTPNYVFAGIIKTGALNGASNSSCCNFNSIGVKEFALTLNGNYCHGFPWKIDPEFPAWPYYKFMSVLGRLNNAESGTQRSPIEFNDSLIFAHKFEGEESTKGWLGITLALQNALTESHTLGCLSLVRLFLILF